MASIDEMPVGLAMDRLMARALGWKRLSDRLWHDTSGRERWLDGITRQIPCWSPSTDIAAAWEVVEYFLDRPGQETFLAFVNEVNRLGWCAPTHLICIRICRAALKAVLA